MEPSKPMSKVELEKEADAIYDLLAVRKYEGRRINSLIDESENTEDFWEGEFGDEYSQRNVGLVENNKEFFDEILWEPESESYRGIKSIIEFGAGIGQNIAALKRIMGPCEYTAIEINESAASLIPLRRGDIFVGSMYEFSRVHPPADLVLTKGVLIHQPPNKIQKAYSIIYESSARYILLCEYYNPTPVEVEYRGHQRKLWKRDFAGEIMDRYPDLKLIDYGFKYHRDEYPQDDLTWFLMEKQ